MYSYLRGDHVSVLLGYLAHKNPPAPPPRITMGPLTKGYCTVVVVESNMVMSPDPARV